MRFKFLLASSALLGALGAPSAWAGRTHATIQIPTPYGTEVVKIRSRGGARYGAPDITINNPINSYNSIGSYNGYPYIPTPTYGTSGPWVTATNPYSNGYGNSSSFGGYPYSPNYPKPMPYPITFPYYSNYPSYSSSYGQPYAYNYQYNFAGNGSSYYNWQTNNGGFSYYR